MLRSAASKVMWVGRATVFAVGLAVILALLFVSASTVLEMGGKPFYLGGSGQTNGIAQLAGSDAEAERVMDLELVAKRRAQSQGYAHVNVDGTFDPNRSKGVNGVTTDAGGPGRYCFDLTFTPNVAVGSPFINNSAVVATATPPDNFNIPRPEGYRDAAVRTYASQDGSPVPVSFKIMFR
jgi:hypothetical protein